MLLACLIHVYPFECFIPLPNFMFWLFTHPLLKPWIHICSFHNKLSISHLHVHLPIYNQPPLLCTSKSFPSWKDKLPPINMRRAWVDFELISLIYLQCSIQKWAQGQQSRLKIKTHQSSTAQCSDDKKENYFLQQRNSYEACGET